MSGFSYLLSTDVSLPPPPPVASSWDVVKCMVRMMCILTLHHSNIFHESGYMTILFVCCFALTSCLSMDITFGSRYSTFSPCTLLPVGCMLLLPYQFKHFSCIFSCSRHHISAIYNILLHFCFKHNFAEIYIYIFTFWHALIESDYLMWLPWQVG